MEYNSNLDEFLRQFENLKESALEEIGGEIESKAIRNTPVGKVNGGKTKNSWEHKVFDDSVLVGNTEETAIWIELGTGDYAINGDGRKGGWWIPVGNGKGQMPITVAEEYGYRIHHGKNGQDFVFAKGMKPKRVLHNSVETSKSKIAKILKTKLGGIEND